MPARAPGFGTLTLGVLKNSARNNVSFGDWKSGWRAFTAPENGEVVSQPADISHAGETHNGLLSAHVVVPPGKSVEMPFFLTWSYPNKYSGVTWVGNHYSATWPDALATVKEVVQRFPILKARTEKFRSVFYDRFAALLAARLRHLAGGHASPCGRRLPDRKRRCLRLGRLQRLLRSDLHPRLGLCHKPRASLPHHGGATCAGSTSNTSRTRTAASTTVPPCPRPRILPANIPLPTGTAARCSKPIAKPLNSPSENWLTEYWPGIKKAVEYLMMRDAATSHGMPNGLLEDDQWNTYDEALHGVSGFIGVYYLAALRAGEVMADRMGDKAFADRCARSSRPVRRT